MIPSLPQKRKRYRKRRWCSREDVDDNVGNDRELTKNDKVNYATDSNGVLTKQTTNPTNRTSVLTSMGTMSTTERDDNKASTWVTTTNL